jgi:transcriptional regulator with XRE-family HTH domain
MSELPIGKAIRKVRIARGYSQRQLALRAGFPRSYVCNIENGIKKTPILRNVERFADGLVIETWKLVRLAQRIREAELQEQVTGQVAA